MPMNEGKVVIIGAGMVGSATLNAVLMLNLVNELVIIDQNENRAKGEALDASHTTAFAYSTNANIRAGTYEDCKDASIIVMTAGPSIKPGEKMDRQILAQKNVDIMTSVMGQIIRYTHDAIIITVTNPVDVVTYCAQKRFYYPKERIMGTGTLLDTARFRQMIAKECKIDSKNVHGYVLGEHGQSSFIPWNLVNVSGVPFEELQNTFDLSEPLNREELYQNTKNVGFDILQLKGYTSSGIAMSVCRIIKAIILNERCILPVSTVLEGEYGIQDVALSVPCVMGREGISRIVNVPMQEEELKQLQACAESLDAMLHNVSIK